MMGRKQSIKKRTTEKRDRSKGYLPSILLLSCFALLTVAAYIRSLNAPLIFDDASYIDPAQIERPLSGRLLHVRSFTEVTFALNYYLSGMNLVPFRLTNILLHIISAALVFYLTLLTFRLCSGEEQDEKIPYSMISRWGSLFVAALFLLHPIQTSAVNYITQRMAIMSALFSFAALIFYAKGALNTSGRSVLYYVLSAFSFVLAVFSKENAVMVIFMLPIYDFFFLSSFQWREFKKRFIPLVVLFIALGVILFSTLQVAGFVRKLSVILSSLHQPIGIYGWTGIDIQWTPLEYLLTELRIVSRYLVLMLLPSPSLMVFDYSNAYPVSRGLFHPASTFFSLLSLSSLLFLSLRYMKRFPLASFGILWYLITISLESFIAIGLDPYMEHRNYLPSFGFFLAVASLLSPLITMLRARMTTTGPQKKNSHAPGVFTGILLSVIAVLLFVLTITRNGVWADEYLLWKDALDKSPQNPRALITLSSISLNKGRLQEAEEYLQRAERIQPMTTKFRIAMLINQATLYRETNRKVEARALLKGLLSEKDLPKDDRFDVCLIMGEILREEGKLSEAREYMEMAYRIKQNNPVLLVSLGFVARSLGEIDTAEGYFKKAVEIAPRQVVPYIELGDISFMKRDMDRAERYYREAVSQESDMPKGVAKRVLLNLAQIAWSKGNTDDATVLLKKITDQEPAFYPPYLFLGDIYLGKNNPATAIHYLEKALSLQESFAKEDPNTKLVYFNLGMAYSIQGDQRRAGKNLRLFLSVAGDDIRLRGQIVKAKERLAQMGG
jgi:tetratricopeptide (TPR) repeat protein